MLLLLGGRFLSAAETKSQENLGDLCESGSAALRAALFRRGDAGKNVVLAVSDAGAGASFVEMTKWFVRDLERTGTPYLFMTMRAEQCDAIQEVIREALEWTPSAGPTNATSKWQRSPGNSAPRCGYCGLGYKHMLSDLFSLSLYALGLHALAKTAVQITPKHHPSGIQRPCFGH
jgi:hypothetical protein